MWCEFVSAGCDTIVFISVSHIPLNKDIFRHICNENSVNTTVTWLDTVNTGYNYFAKYSTKDVRYCHISAHLCVKVFHTFVTKGKVVLVCNQLPYHEDIFVISHAMKLYILSWNGPIFIVRVFLKKKKKTKLYFMRLSF